MAYSQLDEITTSSSPGQGASSNRLSLMYQVNVHRKFLYISDWNTHTSRTPWVCPSEWREYVENPDFCEEGQDVYFRNILPLIEDPIALQGNVPNPCEVMYFELLLLVGMMALIGLAVYILALTAVVIWSIAKGNFGVGSFLLAAFAALPTGILPFLLARLQGHRDSA